MRRMGPALGLSTSKGDVVLRCALEALMMCCSVMSDNVVAAVTVWF